MMRLSIGPSKPSHQAPAHHTDHMKGTIANTPSDSASANRPGRALLNPKFFGLSSLNLWFLVSALVSPSGRQID
jgi:hypothetical protein